MQNVTEQGPLIIGMHVTEGVGSDSYAYEIVSINKQGTQIGLRALNHEPAEGYDYYSNQVYNYSSNPQAGVRIWSRRKTKKGYRWAPKGQKGDGYRLYFGRARHYSDPHF